MSGPAGGPWAVTFDGGPLAGENVDWLRPNVGNIQDMLKGLE